jgi:hypothetical protein
MSFSALREAMTSKTYAEYTDDELLAEWEACEYAVGCGLGKEDYERAIAQQLAIEAEWDKRPEKHE